MRIVFTPGYPWSRKRNMFFHDGFANFVTDDMSGVLEV